MSFNYTQQKEHRSILEYKSIEVFKVLCDDIKPIFSLWPHVKEYLIPGPDQAPLVHVWHVIFHGCLPIIFAEVTEISFFSE